MQRFRACLKAHRRPAMLVLVSVIFQMLVFMGVYLTTVSRGTNMFALSGDEISYKRVAENMFCCSVYSYSTQPPYIPDSVRTPGYSLFLAATYGVLRNWLLVLVFQILLLSTAPLLLYLIARRMDERIAFIASMIFAVEPTRLFWSSLLMSDALFTSVVFVAILFFFRWLSRRRLRDVFFSGAIVGVSMLVRPIALYLCIPFLLIGIFAIGKRYPKTILSFVAVFMLGVGLLSGPWFLRNKIIFNSWQLSAVGSYSKAFANSTQFLHYRTGRPVPEILDEFTATLRDAPDKYNVSLFNLAWYDAYSNKVIGSDPFGYLVFHAVKTIPFFVTDGLREPAEMIGLLPNGLNQPNLSGSFLQGNFFRVIVGYVREQPLAAALMFFGSMFWLLVFLGVIIGAPITLLDPRHRAEWWLLFLLSGYFTLAASGPIAQPRYRLPIEGFAFLFALVGWLAAFQLFRRLTQRGDAGR